MVGCAGQGLKCRGLVVSSRVSFIDQHDRRKVKVVVSFVAMTPSVF